MQALKQRVNILKNRRAPRPKERGHAADIAGLLRAVNQELAGGGALFFLALAAAFLRLR
jgi:hypothetical protein